MGGLSLSLQALKKTSIYQDFQAPWRGGRREGGRWSEAGRWFNLAHTHTHKGQAHTEGRAAIIKIATASSGQHTSAKLQLVFVYTVGGKELVHLGELLV